MKDLAHNIQLKRVISPVSVSDNTAQVGQIISRAGYDSLTYFIATGSLADADATFTVLLEESDASDMTGATACRRWRHDIADERDRAGDCGGFPVRRR
jgi:hypothetical protein